MAYDDHGPEAWFEGATERDLICAVTGRSTSRPGLASRDTFIKDSSCVRIDPDVDGVRKRLIFDALAEVRHSLAASADEMLNALVAVFHGPSRPGPADRLRF